MRRTDARCSYGLQYMTEPRPVSGAEMKENARSLGNEEANQFGESQAFFKLFNSANGSCFYFENRERKKTLVSRFELQIDNF